MSAAARAGSPLTVSGASPPGIAAGERRGHGVGMGRVKWFTPAKGYGFISPAEGQGDVFVHISAVERAGLSTLSEGQKLEYELARGNNGRFSAVDLKLI